MAVRLRACVLHCCGVLPLQPCARPDVDGDVLRWWRTHGAGVGGGEYVVEISAHMAGMAGIVALIYNMHVQITEAFNLLWVMIVAVSLCGILGSARIILARHTLGQVIAGAINGFLCVTLLMQLLDNSTQTYYK